MMVEPAGPLVGKTIEQAGLRQLPNAFLAEIERDGEILPAVGPEVELRANDRLVFVGVVGAVVDLQKIRGLQAGHRPDLQARRAALAALPDRGGGLARAARSSA